MKTDTTNRRTSKLWLALVCGMVCSSVLMLTNHSHAAIQTDPAAQGEQTIVVTAKHMSTLEKARYRAEAAQQENSRA